MGCSICQGHAHQVCSAPGCRDETKDQYPAYPAGDYPAYPALPAYPAHADSTLRATIRTIALATFPSAFVAAQAWPELVRALALEAFIKRWPEDRKTRNIRRACVLFQRDGVISTTEPAVG